ncbi:MAG: cyclase family protein [Haloferacaceae archaeon]
MSDWIELSHPIEPDVARAGFLPAPRMSPIDDASLRATELEMVTHVGTHLEAPVHLVPDGASIDEYDADRFVGHAVVHEVDADPLEEVGLDRIRPAGERLEHGDALLLWTGWDEFVGEERYGDHPYLSEAAAEWVVERGVSWLGVDALSPELPPQARPGGEFDYPVHSTLLENDVLIAENLTNLGAVAGERVAINAVPLRLTGSDGSPARVLARPSE